MSDLRAAIFAADDCPREPLEVEQWGVTLEVRGMTGLERAKFMSSFTDDDGKVNYELMYPSLVINSTYDPETGEKVFQDGDVANLNAKSGIALEQVAGVAMRLSGMDKKAEERLGKDSTKENGASTLS